MTPTMDQSKDDRLPRQALWLVSSRGVSALGSILTAYGLDVWVYRSTGSYATFAYLALIAMIPNLLLAPLSGLVVDRCNKRTLLLACELAPMAAVLAALGLYRVHALGVASVAVVMLVLSLAGAMRWMVLGVTISLIVPAPARGRVNGLQQSFQGVATILGPTLGAAGLALAGLPMLLAADAATCLCAAIALAGLNTAAVAPPRRAALEYSGLWREATHGLRWVFRHRGLSRLLLFFMIFNLGVSIFSVVFAPHMLAVFSNSTLGYGLACQGAGAFLAGLVLARWRGRMNAEANVLGGALSFGLMMAVWGLTRNSAVAMALAFAAGALGSFILTSSQTIWQAQVPVEIQGKVFAARMMVSFLLGPLAILVSVPLADRIFLPVVQAHAWAAWTWGIASPGALAMMVSVLGALMAVGCIVLFARGGLAIGRAGDASSAAVAA